jgi:Preprotein translocase subunit SecA (ATPase, RNA helicase)
LKRNYKKIDHIIVKNLGGLYVIGTERNDSRRIDNQLRGRAGRQGDPGLSRFFLSLDDKLLRLFGGTKFQNFMQNQLLDDLPLESTILTKSLDSAQKRVEESDYDNRKYLFDYDEILNKQRSIIYSDRRDIVNGNEQTLKAKILSHAEQYICAILIEVKQKKLSITDSIEKLENLFGITLELDFFYKFYRKGIQNKLNNALKTKFLGGFKDEETLLKEYLIAEFWSCYELKYQFSEYKDPNFRTSLHKKILLTYYDNCWKEQLQNMSLLRDAVGWRSYGQRNPLFEYKDDSYKLFKDLSKTIRQLVVYECISSEI